MRNIGINITRTLFRRCRFFVLLLVAVSAYAQGGEEKPDGPNLSNAGISSNASRNEQQLYMGVKQSQLFGMYGFAAEKTQSNYIGVSYRVDSKNSRLGIDITGFRIAVYTTVEQAESVLWAQLGDIPTGPVTTAIDADAEYWVPNCIQEEGPCLGNFIVRDLNLIMSASYIATPDAAKDTMMLILNEVRRNRGVAQKGRFSQLVEETHEKSVRMSRSKNDDATSRTPIVSNLVAVTERPVRMGIRKPSNSFLMLDTEIDIDIDEFGNPLVSSALASEVGSYVLYAVNDENVVFTQDLIVTDEP